MAVRLTQLLSKHSQFREYFSLVYTKTVDSVSRALWLATQSVNVLNYSLIHLQFRERFQTRVSCEQNAYAVCCRNKQTNFITYQGSCSRNTRRRWRSSIGLDVLTGKGLSFWKVFCLQMQIKLNCVTLIYLVDLFINKLKTKFNSLALLYLVDLFINKLKTKLNDLFYRMILNTKRIHNSFWRNFPARAKQKPSKVLFVSKKSDDHSHSVIAHQNCNHWQQ